MRYLLLLSALVLSPGFAADLKDKLNQCAKISNDQQRLACFDALTEEAKQLPSVPAPKIEQSQQQQVQNFGLSQRQIGKPEEPAALDIKISKTERDSYGKWLIYLDNGQVWQQTDDSLFRFSDSADYYIEEGMMKSFYLGSKSKTRRIKVKRIK